MSAHIYPSVLQALSGLCKVPDQLFSGVPGETMQDLDYEPPRILSPRTPVNRVGCPRSVQG
jgi:hypothetical protein